MRRRRLPTPALIAAGLLVAAVAAVLLARAVLGYGAGGAASDFLDAWSRGDHRGAAALTDGDPRQVAAALDEHRRGLDGARLEADLERVDGRGDSAAATAAMRWEIPGSGPFDYETELELRRGDEGWLVHWSPQTVHPELEGDERLGTTREPTPRAPILGRDGERLVTQRPVMGVGVVPRRLEDRQRAISAIAAATEAEPRTLERAIEASPPQNFVPAITLREDEASEVEDELQSVPGVHLQPGEQPLAESREFARALLGTVAPATEEQLRELGPRYAVGDQVGQSGLQAEFERQLAGTPRRSVVIRKDGVPIDTLHEVPGERGAPLETTLDADVQRAAEDALDDDERRAAVVAVDPSTGDLLAVANRPVEDSFDRALEGRFPPGSTFKVVTTAALLGGGHVTPETTVDCPQTAVIGGREFRNFESSALGGVPFAEIFAESCNTGFVSLAERLGPGDLTRTGRDFGIGEEPRLPVPAFGGEVPPTRDLASRAAATIGQDRILVSPLALAGMVATVAEGRWRAPRLVADDPRREGRPLPAEQLAQLRALTRQVVTSGTGTALADVSGDVHSKSGTAEYGTGDPPPTHAWFVAYRDDVAVSVLVEGGRSGGEVAAPIAADFYRALGER
jgi:cell division protein FtsI/penicillin-binding protein 2